MIVSAEAAGVLVAIALFAQPRAIQIALKLFQILLRASAGKSSRGCR